MASKFVLKKLKDPDNKFDNTDVVIRIEAETLSELLEGMEDFIRGCGFHLDGTLDIISNEEINNEEE